MSSCCVCVGCPSAAGTLPIQQSAPNTNSDTHHCPYPVAVDNGKISPTGTFNHCKDVTVWKSYNTSCFAGFLLEGAAFRRCVRGVWTPETEPKCARKEPPSCAECFCYEGHPEWEARLCSKHGFPSPGAEFCRESNGTLRQLYDQCGDVTLIESPPEIRTSGKRCKGDTEITSKQISASISSTTERVIVASVGYTTRLSVSPPSSPAGAERLQDVDSDTAMGISPTLSGVAATPSRHSMTHFLFIIFVIHVAIIILL
eukprot:scpid61153/ scgid3420/ 